MAKHLPYDVRVSQNFFFMEIMDRFYQALGDLPPEYFEDVKEHFRQRALDYVETPEVIEFLKRMEDRK